MDGKSIGAEEEHLGRNGRVALLSFGLLCGAAAPAAAADLPVPSVSVPPVSVPPVTVPELLPGATLPPIGVPTVEVPPTLLPKPVVIGPITLDPVTPPASTTPTVTVPADESRPDPGANPAPAITTAPVVAAAPPTTVARSGSVIGPAPAAPAGTHTDTLEPASVSGALTERDRGFFAQFGRDAARIAPWILLVALTIAARVVAASACRDATNGRSRAARRASSASHPAARA